MWTTPEDGNRYRELTHALQACVDARTGPWSLEVVRPEDLADFLEWMGLASEAAPSLQPFVETSAPDVLQRFSYFQMTRYFRYLRSQLTVAGEPDDVCPSRDPPHGAGGSSA